MPCEFRREVPVLLSCWISCRTARIFLQASLVICMVYLPARSMNDFSPPLDASQGSSANDDAALDTDLWKIEVNVAARELRVYARDVSGNTGQIWRLWSTLPVAVGTRRHPTPLVETRLSSGIVRPDWAAPNQSWAGEYAGQRVRFLAAGNPFRTRNDKGQWEGYFIPLRGTGIGLHSTNQRSSIGKPASHGCIRMKLEDVRTLHERIPQGTAITTVYRLYDCSRSGDSILIRSFPDIYSRLTAEERLLQLQDSLKSVGTHAEHLETAVLERLISDPGHDITLVNTAINAHAVTPQPQPPTPALNSLNLSLLAALNLLHASPVTR